MKLAFESRKASNLKDYCGLRIWQKPKSTSVYAIGADVAEGIGADASCAAVIDCGTGMHVASYWSNTIDVDNYATELFKLGTWYNRAFLCIEQNNHGNGIIALLGGSVGSLAYPNLYKRIEYNEYTAKRSKTIGFRTTASTKPRIIENLKSALKSGETITQDRYTIMELGNFVRDEKTGRIGSKGNAKDDRVMAYALAWEQAHILIENKKVTDDSFVPQTRYDSSTGFPITDTFESPEYPF